MDEEVCECWSGWDDVCDLALNKVLDVAAYVHFFGGFLENVSVSY